MIKGTLAAHTIKGFDVSAYQPYTDFPRMKRDGHSFCFLKATEGITYFDKCFKIFWQRSKEAGLIRGAYHFFHPSSDPIKQAENFCMSVGPLASDDLPMVLDWETTDSVPSAQDRIRGLAFLNKVHSLSGKPPIIYGAPYFLHALGLSADFRQYPLWIAHYGVKSPLVPEPWTQFSFWQFSDSGIDYNLFNGSLEQLMKIAHG